MSHSAKGESHRVYWQQWISAPSNGTTSPNERSRRELITSSAAIRIAHTGAQAQDVTHLLRSTLKLGGGDKQTIVAANEDLPEEERDSLVLVGTLYSLPRDTVQFEHELEEELSRSDPYHVVRTLHPTEDPLEIRRRMEEHLKRLLEQSSPSSRPVTRTIISPKLQWFFVPAANETNSLIPNCVELDGYCTSLEDEELFEYDADDDDDDDDDQVDDDVDSGVLQRSNEATATVSHDRCYDDDVDMLARFPWLNDKKQDPTSALSADVDQRSSDFSVSENRSIRENRLFQQLSRSQAARRNRCLTGYLLKRSRKDPHIWRRVHCVLTDEYLWYVSRICTSQQGGTKTERYAKHGRIRLARALLLEPSADYVPLYRIPFAFEVVTGSGTSHWFRASSQSVQAQWIRALSERIVESFESSLMDQAELIMDDESLARSRRMMQLATEPLWEEMQNMNVSPQTNSDGATMRRSMVAPFLGAVLRWGIQVASYRECCRYIHNCLPAKKPVVVVRRRPSHEHATITTMSHPPPEPMDPTIQGIIQSTWTRAAELLTEATRLALQMQPKMPHSIETQSQHIDYIIHGRFRSNSCDQSKERVDSNRERLPVHSARDPPPADLFDHLLSELQALVGQVGGEKDASGEIAATNGKFSR